VSFAEAGLKPGDKAADFTLEDAKSRLTVSLSDYKDQVVVLWFWRVCKGACRGTPPILNRIVAEYAQPFDERKTKVNVLSVNLIDKPRKALSEAEGKNFNFPVLLGKDSGLAKAYQIVTLPQVIVIDAKGNIVYQVMYPDYEILKKVIEEAGK